MAKFSNYEQAAWANEIVDHLRQNPQYVDLVFINCSNKFKPIELIKFNGRNTLKRDENSIWFQNKTIGNVLVAKLAKNNLRAHQRAVAEWDRLLSDESLPMDSRYVDLIYTAVEPSGGDLFGISSVTKEVKARFELKIGRTSKTSIPLNSYTSAGQAKYGEVPHILKDGSIQLKQPSLDNQLWKAKLLFDEIVHGYGSMDEFQCVVDEANQI